MDNKAIQVNQTTRAFGKFFQLCGESYNEKTAKDFRSWIVEKYEAGEQIPTFQKSAPGLVSVGENAMFMGNRRKVSGIFVRNGGNTMNLPKE